MPDIISRGGGDDPRHIENGIEMRGLKRKEKEMAEGLYFSG